MDMVKRLHPLIRRFVAVSLATLPIVVAFASKASARHRKPVRKDSLRSPEQVFDGPDGFTCRWKEEPEHEYVCKPDRGGSGNEFFLSAKIEQFSNPPNPDVTDQSTLAVPDAFSCHTDDPAADKTLNRSSCTYRHRHSPGGGTHVHRFLLSQVVFVSLENFDKPIWVLPHPSTKAHAGKKPPVKKAQSGKAHAVTTVHRGKAYHAKGRRTAGRRTPPRGRPTPGRHTLPGGQTTGTRTTRLRRTGGTASKPGGATAGRRTTPVVAGNAWGGRWPRCS
jgi:hypothetical protein